MLDGRSTAPTCSQHQCTPSVLSRLVHSLCAEDLQPLLLCPALKHRRDDRSVILLNQPFGYGSKGHISITVKQLALYRRHDQADQDFSLKNLGIVLSDTVTQPKLEEYLRSGKCPLQVRVCGQWVTPCTSHYSCDGSNCSYVCIEAKTEPCVQ